MRLRRVAQSQKQQKTRISRLPDCVSHPCSSLSIRVSVTTDGPTTNSQSFYLTPASPEGENTVSLISQGLNFLAWDSAPRKLESTTIACKPLFKKWGEENLSQENQSFFLCTKDICSTGSHIFEITQSVSVFV